MKLVMMHRLAPRLCRLPRHTSGAALLLASRPASTQASAQPETAPSTTNTNNNNTSESSPSRASRLQPLYKSSHKGSGTVPMPRPVSPPARFATRRGEEAIFAAARSSCAEDQGPVPDRPLSPLQRRQLQMRNKAAFVLSPQALRRVKYLLSQYKGAAATEKDKGEKGHAATHNHTSSHNKTNDSNNNNSSSSSSEEVVEEMRRPTGIRIGVRRRGCSGYSYTVNYYFPSTSADAHRPSVAGMGLGDVVVEQDGVQVVVASDALFYVIGTKMDYVVRDVEEKFVFANPNQKYSCGCEESFMPYDEDDFDDE